MITEPWIVEKSWFKDWFASEDYLKVYDHRDSMDAKNLSDLIIRTVNLKPNDFILDAACGAGRHGLYFASKGFPVIGFDLSRTLLLKAKEEAAKNGINPNLLLGDIREIYFKRRFLCVLNLFTSFGYFETDDENFLFVKHSAVFLKERGYYILDYFNKNYLEQNLVPISQRTVGNTLILENRKIENGRVIKRIKLVNGKESKEYFESVKLYDWKCIVEKFSNFGFQVNRIFGNYSGADFNENESPRIIIAFQLC